MKKVFYIFFGTLTRIILTLFLGGILTLFLIIYIIADKDDIEEQLDFEGNFPINDYLFKNAEKKIQENNQFQKIQDKLNEVLRKNEELEKNQKQVIILTPEQERLKNQITANILEKNKKFFQNEKLYIDENGNLIDESGNIIKTKEELEKEAEIERSRLEALKQKQEEEKRKKDPKYANQQFIYKNANAEERKRIKSLAERNIGFNNQEDEYKNKEIEYGVDSFSNFNKQDTGSNEHKLLRTITADKLIPAILIRPISSQLSGEVIAQVETNIYGAMGRAVLIPKGSKIIGKYTNNNKIGQYRLQILWTRILTPQGINILLTDAKGADVKGYSGLIGEFYSRNWERYGLPLSLSTLSNALLIAITTGINNSNKNVLNAYATTQILNQAKTDVSNIISQIIREQIQINPIIIIKEGSRIFISLTQDIFIPTPKKGETLARFFKEEKKEDKSIETQDTDVYFDD